MGTPTSATLSRQRRTAMWDAKSFQSSQNTRLKQATQELNLAVDSVINMASGRRRRI